MQESEHGKSDKQTVMQLYQKRIDMFSQNYEAPALRNDLQLDR